MTGSRYPDLLVSFDADPIAYYRSNGYIISEQGKPPDFVLEIASASTGKVDVTDKRMRLRPPAHPANTGALTKPESITAPGWPATGW